MDLQVSPRPGPRRPQVAVRLSEAGIKQVDILANRAGVTRSEMVRRLLTLAVTDPATRDKAVKP